MIHKMTGLVIQAIDYGETHRILTVLNEQGYKVPIMARGAKKVPSKFTAVAQPFVEAEFVYTRSGGMGTLQHADLIRGFQHLKMELTRSAVAAWSTEMTSRMMAEDPIGPRGYRDLQGLWEQLDDGKEPLVLLAVYELKMIALAGYAMQLETCNRCASKERHTHLSDRDGGAICERCVRSGSEARGDLPVGPRALHWLRLFPQVDFKQIGDVRLKPETLEELRRVIRWWWDRHIGGEWKTRNVLDQLTDSRSICYIPDRLNRNDREE
jgi:DNA repair protein RecO (recombination protein O)